MVQSPNIVAEGEVELWGGPMHSAPTDLLTDLYAAADNRVEDGLIDEDERGEFVAVMQQRLIGPDEIARIRHPVRLRVKGR